jgi:hypothetical protein
MLIRQVNVLGAEHEFQFTVINGGRPAAVIVDAGIPTAYLTTRCAARGDIGRARSAATRVASAALREKREFELHLL